MVLDCLLGILRLIPYSYFSIVAIEIDVVPSVQTPSSIVKDVLFSKGTDRDELSTDMIKHISNIPESGIVVEGLPAEYVRRV